MEKALYSKNIFYYNNKFKNYKFQKNLFFQFDVGNLERNQAKHKYSLINMYYRGSSLSTNSLSAIPGIGRFQVVPNGMDFPL